MARVSSRRGNAVGTPPTLTTLLALPKQTPYVSPPANTWDSYNEPGPSSLRGYNSSWDDARRYHPSKRNAAASSLIRSATRLHISSFGARHARREQTTRGILPSTVQFRVPDLVSVCIRRKARREVLHAKRRTNGRGNRNRNQWSEIKC